MLKQVTPHTDSRSLEDYRPAITDELYRDIRERAADLRGARVPMVNATAQGGGVAEILDSLVPLLRGLGIDATWHVIPPDDRFFALTKRIHNGLQGHAVELTDEDRAVYHEHTDRTAELMYRMNADAWVLHDPQPAGIGPRLRERSNTPLVARVHIDTTAPHQPVWDFIHDFLTAYDRVVFHSREFIHDDVPEEQRVVFPPAIDPLSDKNTELSESEAERIVARFGIDTTRPLMVQVSRFDPWKDPVGVIQTYRQAKERIPGLQLAYLGLIVADDDPEAAGILEETRRAAGDDSDVFLLSDPARLGDLNIGTFVNAFQTAADVVVQKSVREGFGLVVAESMWKGKPVVGGNAGGIKLQIVHGHNGYLVSDIDEAAECVIETLSRTDETERLGAASKERAREYFLMPRLARDYLKLLQELV